MKSADRFAREANGIGVFDQVEVLSEKSFTNSFVEQFQEHLKPGVRGYGYWVWKPWIILTELQKLSENDILVYADVGFTINPGGIDRLREYIQLTTNSASGILGFQAKRPEPGGPVVDDGRSLPEWREKYWTKGDLIDFFGVRDDTSVLDTPTIQAGLIFMRRCKESVRFAQEWFRVFETDFSLVDDSPSQSANFVGFREHRHDQPVFSILGKIHNITTVSSNEFWMPHWWSSIPDWKSLEKTPFHATRSLDFRSNDNAKGSNKDISSQVNLASITINLKLFVRRIVNLFKPRSDRCL